MKIFNCQRRGGYKEPDEHGLNLIPALVGGVPKVDTSTGSGSNLGWQLYKCMAPQWLMVARIGC